MVVGGPRTASQRDSCFPAGRGRDTLADTARPQAGAMIIIECAWCDGELALEAIDAVSVDCPDCGISLDIAPDDTTRLPAAA
jgi:predicted RNA-binding Zn-ribbon protein involved in translation (DUF1610 family)